MTTSSFLAGVASNKGTIDECVLKRNIKNIMQFRWNEIKTILRIITTDKTTDIYIEGVFEIASLHLDKLFLTLNLVSKDILVFCSSVH